MGAGWHGVAVHGRVEDGSRREVLAAIDQLVDRGVAGVIAGCTEIELLVGADDVPVPYYPTTRIHTLAAVDWIVQDVTAPPA